MSKLKIMHIKYKNQLEIKENIVKNNIYKITSYKEGDFEFYPIIPSPDECFYRNKAQIPVGIIDGKVKMGFFAPKSHRIVPFERCMISRDNINEIARNLVQGVAEFLGVLFVSPNEYSGVRKGIVTTSGGRLNVRERPNLEANILTQIPNGETVDVYCTTGLWYVVEYNGMLGFSSAQYIDIPNA